MAVNVPNIGRVPFGFVSGDGVRVNGGELINTMYPPQVIVANSITDPNLATPPTEAYLVPVGATGAWSGQAGKIATSPDNGVTWDFVTPTNGDRVILTKGPNAGTTYGYNGTAWVSVVPVGKPVGTLLKMLAYQGTEITFLGGMSNDYTFTAPAYAPVSANSKIVVAFDAHVLFGSLGADSFRGRLLIANNTVIEKQYTFIDGSGGGGRGGSVVPMIGSWTNNSLTTKSIVCNLKRLSGDDVMAVNTNRSCVIWEYQL